MSKKNTRIPTFQILIIGNYNNHERLNESPVVCLVTDPIHNLVFIFFGCKGTTFFETTKFYGIFSVTITIISIFHCNLDFGTQRRHPEVKLKDLFRKE